MSKIKEQVAKIAAPAFGCSHDDVMVRQEAVPWLRRMRGYRATGPAGGQHVAGLLVVMPDGALTPPLVLASEPVWDQLWDASAVLRCEDLDPRALPRPLLAEICRVTLAGPGGRLATPELAQQELRDRDTYYALAPALVEPTVTTKGKQWSVWFTYVAPDGAVEGWVAEGSEQSVVKAGCQLLHPPDAWPIARR